MVVTRLLFPVIGRGGACSVLGNTGRKLIHRPTGLGFRSGQVLFHSTLDGQQEDLADKTSDIDIIEQVREDHAELEKYYMNYRKASTQDESKRWFNQFLWEISRHSVAEELVLYPLMEKQGATGRAFADQARKEHHAVKERLVAIQKANEPTVLDEKMEQMMTELRQHMKKEEKEDLPYLEKNLDLKSREKAGRTFAMRKKIVPTRPHTLIPEKPVALEAALGLLVAPVDKLRDMFTPFPKDH